MPGHLYVQIDVLALNAYDTLLEERVAFSGQAELTRQCISALR
jgi:hypothetical protein